MPVFEHHRARSPQNQVVTTTIFTGPTQAAPPQSSGNPIPLGAIIGGTVAGATLAVIAVLCWIWWGRSIKKQQQQRRIQQKSVSAQTSDLSTANLPIVFPRASADLCSASNYPRSLLYIFSWLSCVKTTAEPYSCCPACLGYGLRPQSILCFRRTCRLARVGLRLSFRSSRLSLIQKILSQRSVGTHGFATQGLWQPP